MKVPQGQLVTAEIGGKQYDLFVLQLHYPESGSSGGGGGGGTTEGHSRSSA